MQLFTFRIKGVSPILQHNPSSLGAAKSDLSTKKKYVAADEAEASCYRNARKELFIPSIAFRSALLRACTGRKIGKMSAKSVLAASVFPAEQECILLDAKNKPVKDYKIHTARVVIQRASVMRVRAMVENWATDLALEIDTEMLPNVKIVEELLNIAGKVVGVMDWRPEKLGVFGRFTAELVA